MPLECLSEKDGWRNPQSEFRFKPLISLIFVILSRGTCCCSSPRNIDIRESRTAEILQGSDT